MATIDLDRMAKEVHAEAVQKGFWDRADAEAIAISGLHCELSEAYQQDRLGKRMLYHKCTRDSRNAPETFAVGGSSGSTELGTLGSAWAGRDSFGGATATGEFWQHRANPQDSSAGWSRMQSIRDCYSRTGEGDGYCSVDCGLYIGDCIYFDATPEGVAVELADFVLRLLDWVGYKDVKMGNYDKLTLRNYKDVTLPELTAQLHELVSELRTMFGGQGMRHVTQARIVRAIRSVDGWLLSRQMELWSVIVIKRDYNRTRPLLNGKRY